MYVCEMGHRTRGTSTSSRRGFGCMTCRPQRKDKCSNEIFMPDWIRSLALIVICSTQHKARLLLLIQMTRIMFGVRYGEPRRGSLNDRTVTCFKLPVHMGHCGGVKPRGNTLHNHMLSHFIYRLGPSYTRTGFLRAVISKRHRFKGFFRFFSARIPITLFNSVSR